MQMHVAAALHHSARRAVRVYAATNTTIAAPMTDAATQTGYEYFDPALAPAPVVEYVAAAPVITLIEDLLEPPVSQLVEETVEVRQLVPQDHHTVQFVSDFSMLRLLRKPWKLVFPVQRYASRNALKSRTLSMFPVHSWRKRSWPRLRCCRRSACYSHNVAPTPDEDAAPAPVVEHVAPAPVPALTTSLTLSIPELQRTWT